MQTFKKIAIVATGLFALSTHSWGGPVNNANMKTFSAGTPAVAADVNGNFTEHTTQINDNAAQITTLKQQAGFRGPSPLTAYIKARIPNLAPGSTTNITASLVYHSKNTAVCDIRLSASWDPWTLGQNSKGGFAQLTPPLNTYNAPAMIVTGGLLSTTTYSVVQANFTYTLAANDLFMDIAIARADTDALDTCGTNDILVHGIRVSYPNGAWTFIPLNQMTVN